MRDAAFVPGHDAVYVEECPRALEAGGRDRRLEAALRAGLRRARRPWKRVEGF